MGRRPDLVGRHGDAATRRYGDAAVRRHGDTATRRHGEAARRRVAFGVWRLAMAAAQERGNGRAKNSARRMVLLLFALSRAGFEPLLWRGDQGPSARIEGRFGFIGRYHIPRRGSKPARIAWQQNLTLGAPSFSPYRSRVPAPCPFAASPFRPFAASLPYSPAATNSPAGGASIWNCSGFGRGPLT
jgi:hypothetical protein